MLLVSGLKKSYGRQNLLEDVSFTVNPGERIGLVGRNGHGKSTLFKMILGTEEPDDGNISYPKEYRIGYLSQHLKFEEKTILDEVCLALPLLDGSWKETYKAESLLHGLGFKDADFIKPPSAFSGGYQIRLNLVKLLLSEPNLLLLDEPTNYLDIVSIRWLGRFLKEFKGEVIIITHDREFMDSVTTHTLGIHRGKVKKVEGGTEKFYTLLAEEEEIYEKTRLGELKKRQQIENYVSRFRAKASKAKSVQSKVKLLDKMGVKEELVDIAELEFKFVSVDFPGKWPLIANNVSFSYESGNTLIPEVEFSLAKDDRIAVIGPNGKGKTTFLNLLAGELTPNSGEVRLNEQTKLAYFGQTNINRLSLDRTVEEEVWSVSQSSSRTVVRSVCGAMMFEGDTALKKIGVLSGGERSRVLLGKILLTPCNLLLLDEPTNHLDMYSIDALVEAINVYSGAVIFVTHSESLIRQVANRLIVFDRGKVEVFEGGYDDFMRLRGWEDEDEEFASSREKEQIKDDKKGGKKKNKSSKVEAEIEKLEKNLENMNLQLVEETKDGFGELARKLSVDISEMKKKIESKYEELEKILEGAN